MLTKWRKKLAGCIFVVLLFFPLVSAAESQPVSPVYFLSLSDIHFDPFFYCHNRRPCPIIDKLRQAPVSEWSRILSAYENEAPLYGEDTNYSLFLSALRAARETAKSRHAAFVVVLGDFLAHTYQYHYTFFSQDWRGTGYSQFVNKTLMFMTQEINRAFAGLDVYPVVGNNDSYGGDYSSRPNGAFFQETARTWSAFIKQPANRQAFEKQFPTAGYYAVTGPANLRIIALNSVLFSNRARGKRVDVAAMQELDWLHAELQAAKDRQQKVILLMHIPMGVDVYSSLRFNLFTLVEFWDPKYTQRFRVELQAFSPEIAGILAGHLHADWFQILKASNANKIPVSSTPSISPIFGNNPGYKIYTYSPESASLDDFTTYYMPINSKGGWMTEYNFQQIYQPYCRVCPMLKGMLRLHAENRLAERYKQFYAVNTTSQPITTKWNPYYWCAIHEVTASEYKQCVS